MVPRDQLPFLMDRRLEILRRGQPILFRLKRPHNVIAGVGFFVHLSILPVSLAWAAFSVKNGAESERAMGDRVERYRRRFDRQGVPSPRAHGRAPRAPPPNTTPR
jgi:hypothetical protein